MVLSGFGCGGPGAFLELPFVVWLCDLANFERYEEPLRKGTSFRFDFTLGDLSLIVVKSKISASVASSSLARTGEPFLRRNWISDTEVE